MEVKKTLLFLLVLAAPLWGQGSSVDRKQIRELDPLVPSAIADDTAVLFGVDKTDVPKSYHMSLASLKKTGVQVVNVKQYGVVGDGVTDDTVKIQDVLSECGNKRIYFPKGTYKISETVSIGSGQENWTIEGDGQATIFLSAITDGSAVLDLNGAEHFTIKDFKIANTAQDTSVSSFVGIDFNGATRWYIENVLVFNASTGIDFDTAYIGQITQLFIRYCTLGFTGSAMNDVTGVFQIENVSQGFVLTGSNVMDISILCEGSARTSSSTIDNCRNVKLVFYCEDAASTLREVPELSIGTTTRCFNIDLFLRSGAVTGPAKTFTADASTDTCTAASHGFSDGTACLVTTTGTRPAPLSANVMYYIVGTTASTFQLSNTPSGSAIDLTDAGTGTHTVTTYSTEELIALDDVDGCRITGNYGASNSHSVYSATSDTKNLTINSQDPTNNPGKPSLIPSVIGNFQPVNYWPNPFMFEGIPSGLTDVSATSSEETTIVPAFAVRSLKVASDAGAVNNFARKVYTFAEYPQFEELKGKTIGVGWWQYYPSTANYSPTSSGNGPDCRILTDGSPAGTTTVRWSVHERGKWHFVATEVAVPSDATQFTQYFYSNRGVITSDTSMISSFGGPVVWVGGLANAARVLNGDFVHHPSALKSNLVRFRSGAGSPEGSVSASIGSLYLNTSGGSGTTLYIKESGTGNTGWVAK